jgi:hypothetical protein
MGNLGGLLDLSEYQRLLRQVHLHGRSLRQREIDRFGELGVRAIDLGSPWPVLADRVLFEGEFFSFADDAGMIGEPAFTMAVISNTGMTDIAAWQPEANRLALWCGAGFALGERQIHHPNPLVPGLPVFRTPIGWLRTGRCGIVIIRSGFARAVLGHVSLLIAEDELHRSELQDLLGMAGPDVELRCEPACLTAETAS